MQTDWKIETHSNPQLSLEHSFLSGFVDIIFVGIIKTNFSQGHNVWSLEQFPEMNFSTEIKTISKMGMTAVRDSGYAALFKPGFDTKLIVKKLSKCIVVRMKMPYPFPSQWIAKYGHESFETRRKGRAMITPKLVKCIAEWGLDSLEQKVDMTMGVNNSKFHGSVREIVFGEWF